MGHSLVECAQTEYWQFGEKATSNTYTQRNIWMNENGTQFPYIYIYIGGSYHVSVVEAKSTEPRLAQSQWNRRHWTGDMLSKWASAADADATWIVDDADDDHHHQEVLLLIHRRRRYWWVRKTTPTWRHVDDVLAVTNAAATNNTARILSLSSREREWRWLRGYSIGFQKAFYYIYELDFANKYTQILYSKRDEARILT